MSISRPPRWRVVNPSMASSLTAANSKFTFAAPTGFQIHPSDEDRALTSLRPRSTTLSKGVALGKILSFSSPSTSAAVAFHPCRDSWRYLRCHRQQQQQRISSSRNCCSSWCTLEHGWKVYEDGLPCSLFRRKGKRKRRRASSSGQQQQHFLRSYSSSHDEAREEGNESGGAPTRATTGPYASTLDSTGDGLYGLVGPKEAFDKYAGVQPARGRFEVKLQKGRSVNTLIFSSHEEAAKAYDRAVYKLHGDDAKTNFVLTEEDKTEVSKMDWDELLLHLQLQDLARSSPSRLGFPGVCYKDEDQSWVVNVRHKNQAYVGHFPSMNEATKAYDLAAYKIQGRDALLSHPLSSVEKMEVIQKDWNALVAKLGLKVRAPRQRRTTECRGVRLRPSGNYLASFSHKGYYFYLGTFDSRDAAAKAYDLFAYKVLGDGAKINSALSQEEKEFLTEMSVVSLRNHLASQAIIAPKLTVHLGARGARMVRGEWEVVLENSRKDRIYISSASSEQEAVKVHDTAVHKLHKGMGKTYAELNLTEQRELESVDWSTVASKLNLRQTPSYRGVNRLISGYWQSYIRHGGAYLAIGTFDSAVAAARSSDKCKYKLLGENAVLNFPFSEKEKQEIGAVDWGTLVTSIRADQRQSPVLTRLGGTSALASSDISTKKKWMLLLCHEQLLQQQMTRRAPKVGRQLVVANPSLALQFSDLNRRADESPMLVEEVMEGSNAPLLWLCPCGKNVVLKAPMGLLRARQVVCKMSDCDAKPQSPIRLPAASKKKNSLDEPNGTASATSVATKRISRKHAITL